MTKTEPLRTMVDAATPLCIAAFMIGHEDESVRDGGMALLSLFALSYVEYINYIWHIQSCPKCMLRIKLLEIMRQEEPA